MLEVLVVILGLGIFAAGGGALIAAAFALIRALAGLITRSRTNIDELNLPK